MAEHLYTHNIIDSPICKNCELESESDAHYLLKCPVYGAQRARFLSDLITILDGDYIANVDDHDIVNLFLNGDREFPMQSNLDLNRIAQTYIIDSKRFADRASLQKRALGQDHLVEP